MLSKFAKTLVEIARRREARRNAILSEQAKRIQESEKRRRAEELAEHSYEEEIFREAQRQNQIEEQDRIDRLKIDQDYRAGLWLTLITKKNLERAIDGLREILSDVSHSGLHAGTLDKLTYLTRLAGNDVKSYEEIEARVQPILVEQAREELRRKLSGNSHQEYFASSIGYNSIA